MVDRYGYWRQGDMAEARATALELFHQGYSHQVDGRWADAIACYRESLMLYPTAEAHTFLGWTYSLLGLYDEAIRECQRAIEVDPTLGNPYNDIGAYLIELGRYDEAIPWLEQAIRASRYDARCYPYYNLGRIYEHKGNWPLAILYYKRALAEDPGYDRARTAWMKLQARLN
jgi:tetratricopeptide (TPR) repeat protein